MTYPRPKEILTRVVTKPRVEYISVYQVNDTPSFTLHINSVK